MQALAPRRLCVLFALAALASADDARAEQPGLAFEWDATDGCPSRDDMLVRVRKLLDDKTAAREPLAVRAVVRVEAGAYGATVQLTSKGKTTERYVEGDSCGAVADATALVVAIAIDPEAVAAAQPAPAVDAAKDAAPASAEAAGPTPEVAAANAARPRPVEARAENAPAPERRSSPFASLALVVDSSILPAASVGGEVAIGYRARRLALSLAGSLLAARQGHLEADASAGADVRAFGFGPRGFFDVLPTGSAFELGPSLGGDLTWLDARGFGSLQPKDATVAILRVRAGGRVAYRISDVRIFAEPFVTVPLSRPSFVIDGSGTVDRIAAIGFVGSVGAELHF